MSNNNVYITQYNYTKLIPKELDEDIKKDVINIIEYMRLKKIFNSEEINQFSRLWAVLEHPDFLLKYYSNISRKDMPETYSSYHSDVKCIELCKNYLDYSIKSTNLKIRNEISSICRTIFDGYAHQTIENRIRFDFNKNQIIEYYKKNNNIHEVRIGEIPLNIFNRINKLYQNYPDVLGKNFDIVPNSGLRKYENQSLESIELKIKKLLNESECFRNSNETIAKEINNITYADIPKIKKMKSKNKQIWVKNYKEPLSNLVQNYYWIKFNPDLTIQKNVLDSIGFKPCKRCYS